MQNRAPPAVTLRPRPPHQGTARASPQVVFDVLVDILFYIDIVINFRTVYYDEEYEMVLGGSRTHLSQPHSPTSDCSLL